MGAPGVSVPVHALDHGCRDARYPTLAGVYAIGCGPLGEVDRAVHLPTGQVFEVGTPHPRPGVASNALFVPGEGLVVLRVDRAELVQVTDVVRAPLVAPAATDGVHAALLTEDRLWVARIDATTWSSWSISPREWDAPALAWPWVAWAAADERIWKVDANLRSTPVAISGERARHVVSDGDSFVWVEDGDIVHEMADGSSPGRFETATGFNAPPTVSGGVICWETRDSGSVDVVCSDGTTRATPEDETWPSLSGRFLLYRVDHAPWLYLIP